MTLSPARAAAAASLFLGVGLAPAQHASSLPPPSYSGTVEARSDRALVVSADPFGLPQHYRVTGATACVDAAGRPLPAEAARQGALVTVYSRDLADPPTAATIVVRSSP